MATTLQGMADATGGVTERTLRRPITVGGIGLHSGRPVTMRIAPAPGGTGIRFRRSDVTDRDPVVPARFDRVSDTTLSTRIANADGVSVGTIEHVMAALAGLGIHNAEISLDSEEVPILDGASEQLVRALLAAGIVSAGAPLSAIRVIRPLAIVDGPAEAAFAPADCLQIDFEIDFTDAAIGRQALDLAIENGAFVRELANCRTFCRFGDVRTLRRNGLARGGSLDNAVVVHGERVLNRGGFRRPDECVRHKMLDAVGDLALAGRPILGVYRGVRAGHRTTNLALRALMATPEAWELVPVTEAMAPRLPGYALLPDRLRVAG